MVRNVYAFIKLFSIKYFTQIISVEISMIDIMFMGVIYNFYSVY